MSFSQSVWRRFLGYVAAWLLVPGLAGVVGGCSSDGRAAGPLPAGHYEGPVTYHGSELRAVLDLRQGQGGQMEADLRFPEYAGLGFPAENLRYKAPILHFEQQAGAADNMTVEAIREGDFWRGTFVTDSIQAELLLVRRGKADPRPYGTQVLTIRYGPGNMRSTLRLPDDTLRRHPALVVLPDSATNPSRLADLLARQGFATLVTQVPPAADSAAGQMARAALATLRATPGIDTTRVGMWLTGKSASAALAAAGRQKRPPAFVVAQAVPATSAETQQVFRALARKRIPILALYGGADTSLNVPESTRRLRGALGGRSASIRIYPNANHDLLLPGRSRPDGKWEWPHPAPGYVDDLLAWLRARK